MTLRDLLADYVIYRPITLARRTGLSRQYAHLLWTGQRHLSRKMARKMEAYAGIPAAALLEAKEP